MIPMMSKSASGKAHRTFLDIVNWEMLLAPGVIGCRDGSMIAGWQVTGIDTETMEVEEIEAWLDQVDGGLSGLGDGHSLRLVRTRRKWKPRHPDADQAGAAGSQGESTNGGGDKPAGDRSGSDASLSDHHAEETTAEAAIVADGQSALDGAAGVSEGAHAEALSMLFMEQQAILATNGYLWQDTITLYYHRCDGPPAASGGLAAAISGGMTARGLPETAAERDEALKAFETHCRGLEDRLGGALGLRRLGAVAIDEGDLEGTRWTGCELTASLFSILGLPERPVRIDPQSLPVPLDHLIDIEVEQQDRQRPGRIGNRPAALMVLEGFEGKKGGVQTGRLAHLQSQPLEFTWVVAYGALSANTMRKLTREKQKFLRQGAADMPANIIGETQGKRDRYEDQAAEDLEEALMKVSGGATGYGVGGSWFLVTGEAGKQDASIAGAVRDLGAVPTAAGLGLRRETVNFVPALLSMLPGHEGLDARAFALSAHAVSGLMPLRSIWQGEPTCPSPLMPPKTPALLQARSQTGELVNFNLHCGDLGHGLIFGPTGAGKSVLLGLLAAAFLRYENAQVIYFDRQRSIAHACMALGGVFMEPGGDGPAGIAPFSDMRELGKDWAIRWLETLVRLEGVEPTAKMIEDLHRCVNNCSKLEKRPTMTDVLSYVQFHELRTAFAKFVDDGTYGTLFSQDRLFDTGDYAAESTGEFPAGNNGGSAGEGKADPASGGEAVAVADNGDADSATKASEEPDVGSSGKPDGVSGGKAAVGSSGKPDGDSSGGPDGDASGGPDGDASQDGARSAPAGHPSFSVFETHAMMDASETVRVLSLDYIFEKVQRRFDGRPTLVVFDEAWSFFSHKLFIERIRSWLKEGRKNNVGVLMATQSLNDAIRSELTAELMESCPTKIFLPNMQAQTKASADSYRALGLSEPEIAQIARMRPKRDYYVTQPEGRRVLSFPIGHLGLSIVGRTSAKDSRRALAAVDRSGRPHNRGGRPHTDFWKEGISDAFQKMGATQEQWQSRNGVGGETRRGISGVRKQENPPSAGQRQETAQTQTDGQRPDKEDKAAEPVATRGDGSDESAAQKHAAHGTEAQDAEQETAG